MKKIEPIRIINRAQIHASGSSSNVGVAKWFLDLISKAETINEVRGAMEELRASAEEDLCKRKSLHLATIRIKIINENNRIKKGKQRI